MNETGDGGLSHLKIIFGITEISMDKVIYFNNDDRKKDRCAGKTYFDFLDYAFSKTDYFMLVYVNYYGKGYTQKQKYFKKVLEPFKVKCRSNPSWPGTLNTFSEKSTYKIIFYRNDDSAKQILKECNCLSDWSRPKCPEDLAFFKGNECWFYSVGHEMIAAIISADKDDLDFVESKGLALKEKAKPRDCYFDLYNEILDK